MDENRRLNGMVAHELRGPLQVLMGISYDLKRPSKKRPNENYRGYSRRLEKRSLEHSEKISRVARHMGNITHLLNLQGMTKKELLEDPQELDLEERLEDIAMTYNDYLRERKIKLETHYDTPANEPPKIYGNSGVFSTLLATLSGNAITYAPENSMIKEGLWVSPRNLHYFLENEVGERNSDSPGMGKGRGFPFVKSVTETLEGGLKTHRTPKFQNHEYTRSKTYGYTTGPSEFNGDTERYSVEIMIPMSVLTPPENH
jgi:signal transduction histidine kinase